MDERYLDEPTRALVAQLVRKHIGYMQALLDAAKNGSYGDLVLVYDNIIEALRQDKEEAYQKFNAQRVSWRPIPPHPSAAPISTPLPRPAAVPSIAARIIEQGLPTNMLPDPAKGRPLRNVPPLKQKRKPRKQKRKR